MTCKVPEVFGNSQGEFGVEIFFLGKMIFDDSIFGNIIFLGFPWKKVSLFPGGSFSRGKAN